MHLTFEEYFAARELVRRPDRLTKRIYGLRHQPRWEEPILLAIGFVSEAYPDLPGDLIRTAILAEGADACERGFKSSPREKILHRDLLLATQCIGDCVTIDATLRRQVIERLVNLSAIARKRRNMDRVAHLTPPHRRRRTPLESNGGVTSIIAEGGSFASE